MIYTRRAGRVLAVSIIIVVCFMTLVRKARAQPIGTWTLTGSLNDARANIPGEFLVPLSDGRILAIGGFDSTVQEITSVEVYDRSTENWILTNPLGIARYSHTSTVLFDGSILVAGGNSLAAETSAELYDPNTETFSPTGTIGAAHKRHTATLLPNGKVLIAGGVLGAPQNSADLYNPTSGTFTPTDPMETPRQEFTATLLQNGQVLIAGGQFCASPPNCVTPAAELYDPNTETFSPTGSLGTRRSLHTATRLQDGRVLIVGGTTTAPGSGTQTATAEIYNPNSETFSPTGNLITARREHTATLLPDGRVLIAGGFGASDVILSSVEIYDPTSGMFSAAESMNVARARQGAALLQSGEVLVAGGNISGGGVTNTAELLDLGLVITVDIDIKPGSDPNCFNVDGNGVIPVAVLGSDVFDVTQIDVETLDFAGLEVRVKGNDARQCSVEDVSGDFTTPDGVPDGYPDLVCQFVDDPGTWVPNDDSTATLTGNLFDGTPFEGTDSICIVP